MPGFAERVSRADADKGPSASPRSVQPEPDKAHFAGLRASETTMAAAEMLAAAPRVAQLKAMGDVLSGARDGAPTENRTGMPDALKAGIEALSGIAMDDVRVHRNSSAPAQMQAHAFAQGSDIHLAPGQEQHLPHEAWHVVQQKQGRVAATRQLKGGVAINDDAGLESEADVMGARALDAGDPLRQAMPASAHCGASVRQLVETLAQKIRRVLRGHGIAIADGDAGAYAADLTAQPNAWLQIRGHHRAIKLFANGAIHTRKQRPPRDAGPMRMEQQAGPFPAEHYGLVTEGPRPLEGSSHSQSGVIDMSSIRRRRAAGDVMGGSAAELSEQAHAEWLHLVAHSLGGLEIIANMRAGSHALNTAMIPYERFGAAMAANQEVHYTVTFFMVECGEVEFAYAAEISIEIGGLSSTHSIVIPISLRGLRINAHAQEAVMNSVASMRATLGLNPPDAGDAPLESSASSASEMQLNYSSLEASSGAMEDSSGGSAMEDSSSHSSMEQSSDAMEDSAGDSAIDESFEHSSMEQSSGN